MEYITKGPEETKGVAHKFADTLIEKAKRKTQSEKQGTVIALTGDLGSGKTTFVQGLAQRLGITQRLTSPTFILMRRYSLKKGMLYHLDAYRLNDNVKSEVENLGLPEIFSNPENIVLIEWAEKIKNFLPDNTKWIQFEYIDDETRRITFSE